MKSEKDLPKRKRTRWENFDYSTPSAYFLTICTENRRNILSQIAGLETPDDHNNVGGDVLGAPRGLDLLPFGKIADKYIRQLNQFYDHVDVDQYVIMPNHIHIILFVLENGLPRTSSPTEEGGSPGTSTPTSKPTATVPLFVSTFKRFCNKEYGENIWQRGFYDHVIRNRNEYEEISRYIYENPMRWYFDELYSDQ